jgi:hypothetical protein
VNFTRILSSKPCETVQQRSRSLNIRASVGLFEED